MFLRICHELVEIGIFSFHCLLGGGNDVDGVNQLGNRAEFLLKVHGKDFLQVQHDVGLCAQHKGVTVGRLLVGKVDAVGAACALHVHDLNRHAQIFFQYRLKGTKRSVRAAAYAPWADDGDLALPLPVVGRSLGIGFSSYHFLSFRF